MQMANRGVTANTGHTGPAVMVGIDGLNDNLMTFPAGIFGDVVVAGRYLDGFMEPSCCKGIRMPKSVGRLGGVFGNDARRGMAIVTGGYRPVA